uniref:uncharacterized protein LOC100178578 isoform X1 n=1 Tax=Ciona intestinalis TaxID=7719 RepID=UPI000521C69D|nr:uncharacterized protein LOC100178578 isoform X1 [Ciona intestinalis]|eukprot:XP_009858315.1 uncharacterized protein LOC100178578 isoform X1 [Ciona intestinalis]
MEPVTDTEFLSQRLKGYEEFSDYCTGYCVTHVDEFIADFMLATDTYFIRESFHQRGTSKRLKKDEPTCRTLRLQHECGLVPISFTGFLFQIIGNQTWNCNVVNPQKKKTRKRKKGSSGVCTATIQVRTVRAYPEHTLDFKLKNCKDSIAAVKSQLMVDLTRGKEVETKIIHFCRFSLSAAHKDHITQPSSVRIDSRVLAKIKVLANSGFHDANEMSLVISDYVLNTLFAGSEDSEKPTPENKRYFPPKKLLQRHIGSSVGRVKQLPGYVNPLARKETKSLDNPVVHDISEICNSSPVKRTHSAIGVGMIAIHLGAGFHSRERWPLYKQLCEQTCTKVNKKLKDGITAGEAVALAVKLLEDSQLTNAGFGSNLTEDGRVECDASVMDASMLTSNAGSVTYGAVSCVGEIKNPVMAAYELANQQAKGSRLSLGRIPPCSLSGQGAEKWARAHGVEMCDEKNLISESAYKTWQKYQRRLLEHILRGSKTRNKQQDNREEHEVFDAASRLDTVGAVALDIHGKVASAASSGGLLMKLSGRVGQAATYGCGCWAENGSIAKPSVAVCTTGCGEQLVYAMAAKKCADNLMTDDQPYTAVQNTLLNDVLQTPFLNSDCEKQAGILALHEVNDGLESAIEVVWGHTTSSMIIGHMSTKDKVPEVVVSRLPSSAVAGKSVSVSGTWIKVLGEDTQPKKSPDIIAEIGIMQMDGNSDSVFDEEDLDPLYIASKDGGLDETDCSVTLSAAFNRKEIPEFEKTIEERWKLRKEKNPRLFNGQKFRVHSVEEKNGKLNFNLGITCYRDYMETNWAPEVKYLQEKGTANHFNSQAYLSEPLGVAAIIATSDDQVIFQQRNHWLAEGAGQMDVPGGHPEPSEAYKENVEGPIPIDSLFDVNVLKEIFESIQKEVRDEVNIPLSDLEKPKLLGLVRNRLSGGRAVAYFYIKCNLTSSAVRSLYSKGGAETDESTLLTFLPEKGIPHLQQDDLVFWNQLCQNGKAACTIYSIFKLKRFL